MSIVWFDVGIYRIFQVKDKWYINEMIELVYDTFKKLVVFDPQDYSLHNLKKWASCLGFVIRCVDGMVYDW